MSITEKSGREGLKQDVSFEQVSSGPAATVGSWAGVASDRTLIGELQEALVGNNALQWEDLDIAIRVRLRVVARRLAKIRGLGGMYGQVSLSAELEAMMNLMPTAEDAEHKMLVH